MHRNYTRCLPHAANPGPPTSAETSWTSARSKRTLPSSTVALYQRR